MLHSSSLQQYSGPGSESGCRHAGSPAQLVDNTFSEGGKLEVSRLYGMLQPAASTAQAVRAVFFIDPQSKVRALLYYPLSNGRNFQEIKRLLMAMQTTDREQVATPADWHPGEEVIVPLPGSCGAAKERVESKDPSVRCVDWFLCFKKVA